MVVSQKILIVFAVASVSFACSIADATVYHVGPDHRMKTPDEAPWNTLVPGDEVHIHFRPAPYRVKWCFARQGTASKPIVVRGIAGPNGERPIIDGENAITPPGQDFTSGQRGVIKIGYSNIPSEKDPKYLVIEGLEIRGARPGRYFIGRDGLQEYSENASAIFVEKGNHITVRNCVLTDCGNGFFSAFESRNLLVEGCYIHGNGTEGSYYEHNSYTAGINITFRFNRFGPLREGCTGNNLKDRSANLKIVNNWIEGGNRQLDLVDGEDDAAIVDDDNYGTTVVAGNVLVEFETTGNNQIVHYGGDSGELPIYRKGTLYFVNNTVVATRPGKIVLLRLSTNEERAVVANNILYTTDDGSKFAIVDETGIAELRNNWLKPGFRACHGELKGRVGERDTITGEDPGFVDPGAWNLALKADSECVDAGRVVDGFPAIDDLEFRFAPPLGQAKRVDKNAPDIGAIPMQ